MRRQTHGTAVTLTYREPAESTRGEAGFPRRSVRDQRAALARLLPLWPHEIADESLHGRALIVARLRKALRAERRRGIEGHWTYDLGRHAELLRLYRAERSALLDMLRNSGS